MTMDAFQPVRGDAAHYFDFSYPEKVVSSG